jgi:Tetratricopeptide repeat
MTFTLTSMGNLASTYRNQGRWKEAEALGVQVMETSLRVLGQEHPDTLNSMGILASTFWNQGQVMARSIRRIGPMLSYHQNAVLLECTNGNILLRCSDAESSPKRCFDRERDRIYERKYIALML